MAQRRQRGALAALLIGGGALVLWQTRGQTLDPGGVAYLSDYRSLAPGVLLHPLGGELSAVPAFVHQVLFAVFGADSHLPVRIVHALLAVVGAALVHRLATARIGFGPAMAPAAIVLLLGSATGVVPGSGGIPTLLAVCSGLGAMLALERDDRRGDFAAAGLLAIAVLSGIAGLAFTAAATMLLGGRSRNRRWWIAAAPAAIYAVWLAWAVRFDGAGLAFGDLGGAPTAALTAFASGAASAAGLFRDPAAAGSSFEATWGWVLAAALVGAAVFARRGRRPADESDRRLLALAAAAAAYWGLIGLGLGQYADAEDGHYRYLSAVLVLLACAEIARRWAGRRWVAGLVGIAVAASLLANTAELHQSAADARAASRSLRGTLAAAEILRERLEPGARLGLSGEPASLEIEAGEYLAAAGRRGSPAYSSTALVAAPGLARDAADRELARLGGAELVPERAGRGPDCRRLEPDVPGTIAEIEVPPGGLALFAGPGPPVSLSLGRYSDRFPVALPSLAGSGHGRVTVAEDDEPVRWRLQVLYAQSLFVCPGGGK